MMACKDISTVSDVLKSTGGDVLTVAPEETVRAAAQIIDHNKKGMAVVRGPDERMLGVVSVIDVNRAVANHGEHAPGLPVGEIMNTAVVSCAPEDQVQQALDKMNTYHIRHLPVVEHGILRGLVTMRDLLQCGRDKSEALDQETIERIRGSIPSPDCH